MRMTRRTFAECERYRPNLRADSFGECVCGRARADHSEKALQAAATKPAVRDHIPDARVHEQSAVQPAHIRKAVSFARTARGVQDKLTALAAKQEPRRPNKLAWSRA